MPETRSSRMDQNWPLLCLDHSVLVKSDALAFLYVPCILLENNLFMKMTEYEKQSIIEVKGQFHRVVTNWLIRCLS